MRWSCQLVLYDPKRPEVIAGQREVIVVAASRDDAARAARARADVGWVVNEWATARLPD